MKVRQLNITQNKSMFFLLPLTFIERKYFTKALNYYALNAHRPELDNHIFVIFDKDLIDDSELSKFQMFSTYLDTETFGEYVLVTFKLPPYFKNDRDLFLEGKYSKYSDKAKVTLSQHLDKYVTINGKKVLSNGFKILYPTSEDRALLADALGVKLEKDAEIYSSPSIEEETFNVSNFYTLFESVV